MSDIFDLFVRINSTGKPLTEQEKRKAIYYNSPFLQEAAKLARNLARIFEHDLKIMSAGQIARMKHIELVSELMLSLHSGTVLDKKKALNKALDANSFDNRSLKKASGLVNTVVKRLKTMFPDLKQTRFAKITDFYALAVLVGQFEQQGLILTNRNRNEIAWRLLKSFATKVDEINLRKKSRKAIPRDEELYHKYWLTVIESTDSAHQRQQRVDILRGLLSTIFERKDMNRQFSEEQRRILFNSTNVPICTYPGCKKVLSWEDFTMDHRKPHSKGGKSILSNAALMCKPHNSAKGNRPRTKPSSRARRTARAR